MDRIRIATLAVAPLLAISGIPSLVTPVPPQDAADAADADARWIEGDMDAAYAKAKETGKPILVAFR
ncbi:MAG: hypothetical protein ACYTG4_10170 [Planctomycetota bacterium]|jgi:hypothetical protein